MLAYYLYREKHIMPGEFAKMSPGERLVLEAFATKEMEDIVKRRKG